MTQIHSGKALRFSGLELLRIIGMVMVIFNHSPFSFLLGRYFPEVGTAGSAIMTVLSGFGGVGDILFFGITAWFLVMEEPNLRRSARRIWMLEKHLLTISIFLYFIFLCLQLYGVSAGLSGKTIIIMALKTIFPVIGRLWWYPTSYVVFLLIHPWLQMCLRSLGLRSHLYLVIMLVIVWGFTPMHTLDMTWSVVLFVYLYAIISFIRWYVPDSLITRFASPIMVIGLCATIFGLAIMGIVWSVLGTFARTVYFNSPRSVSSLMAGLGLIVIFGHMKWYSKVINKIASTMFTSYLFIAYPLTRELLPFLLRKYLLTHNDTVFIGCALLFPLLFVCFSSVIDIVRQLFFVWIIDRHHGRLFDRWWGILAERWLFARIEFLFDLFATKNNGKKLS